MSKLKIRNEFVVVEIEVGKEYLITDDMWYQKRCRIIDYGDRLVMIDFVECESYEECEYYNDGLKPVLDVTEDTPTLYVITEDGDEIGILVDEIVSIELVHDNFGEAC